MVVCDIEGELIGFVFVCLSFWCFGELVLYMIEEFCVGCDVGVGCVVDGFLVDVYYMLDGCEIVFD